MSRRFNWSGMWPIRRLTSLRLRNHSASWRHRTDSRRRPCDVVPLKGSVRFPTLFNALALDAQRPEVPLTRRRGPFLPDLLADGTFGLVVKDELVHVFNARGVKLCNLGHRCPLWRCRSRRQSERTGPRSLASASARASVRGYRDIRKSRTTWGETLTQRFGNRHSGVAKSFAWHDRAARHQLGGNVVVTMVVVLMFIPVLVAARLTGPRTSRGASPRIAKATKTSDISSRSTAHLLTVRSRCASLLGQQIAQYR